LGTDHFRTVTDWGGLLLALCSADRAPDPAVLNCPGGFSWFYVDLVDEQGRGATVIWSWGLPFLPGYAGAARAGQPELPVNRPSVNVVVYGDGRERFYLLSELPAEQCSWGPDGRSWRLGDCSFNWVDDPSPDGASTTRALQGHIDLALPTGGRVTGRLWLSGTLRRDSVTGASESGLDTHLWTPMLAASRGGLELCTPDGDFYVEGRGYHDRNSAAQPLHRLGIQSWWWGRLALPGRDLIFYRLTPSAPGAAVRDLVVELSADGSSRVCEDAGLEVGRLRRSPWGLRWPSSATFPDPDGRQVKVEISALLDNGPFYQRYLLHGTCGGDEGGGDEGGEEGWGIGEHLVTDRVDTDLLRPLVRMRVHRTDGPNSMWLPLFSGDSEGRWSRLIGRSGGVRT
jgi:carotenoid 1,2-hydratase